MMDVMGLRARKNAIDDLMKSMDDDSAKRLPGVTIAIEGGKGKEQPEGDDSDSKLASIIRKKLGMGSDR